MISGIDLDGVQRGPMGAIMQYRKRYKEREIT